MRLQKKVIDSLLAGWKNEDIYEKATTAMLLWRTGREGEAKAILESLRQFASYEPAKGMWFDNLSSSYYGAGKLLTTARVLQAFTDIEPAGAERAVKALVAREGQHIEVRRVNRHKAGGLCSVEQGQRAVAVSHFVYRRYIIQCTCHVGSVDHAHKTGLFCYCLLHCFRGYPSVLVGRDNAQHRSRSLTGHRRTQNAVMLHRRYKYLVSIAYRGEYGGVQSFGGILCECYALRIINVKKSGQLIPAGKNRLPRYA